MTGRVDEQSIKCVSCDYSLVNLRPRADVIVCPECGRHNAVAALARRSRDSVCLRRNWLAVALKALLLYCVISIATLPSLNAIWLGEVPVLAIPQVPKVKPAEWLRTSLVVPVIRLAGLSRGSPSPDSILARPYALALVYMIVLGVVAFAVVVKWQSSGAVRHRWWLLALIVAAIADVVSTLAFASGPGLTIY